MLRTCRFDLYSTADAGKDSFSLCGTPWWMAPEVIQCVSKNRTRYPGFVLYSIIVTRPR